jgi:hypothetical protein
MFGRRALAAVLVLFVSIPAFSVWKTLKTEAFTVFYPKGREREAEEILQVLEHYRGYVGDLVGGPSGRVAIVLEDAGIGSNGLTDVTFRRILLLRSPPSSGELGYHQNWWRLVGVHEYTHWGHLSAARELPSLLTAVFGNNLAPGNYTPGWLKEGISVVAESRTSPYEGRLNEGLFDAYAMILAQTGSLPKIVQATYNVDVFPAGTGPYLFGGQFVEFLVRKYGQKTVARFFMHYSASILSYLFPAVPEVGLDRSAQTVFGQSIRSLWDQWQVELMRTSVSFKRPEQALTDHGWWLDNPAVWAGQVYYQHTFPVKPAPFFTTRCHQLMRLDPASGASTVLFRSAAPFNGPMRIRNDKLYYGLLEIEGGYENHLFDGFGYTSVLYSMDLGAEGQSRAGRKLFREPFRTFEVLPDGAIVTAVDRRDGLGSVILLHDPAGGASETVLVTDLLVTGIAADSRNIFVAARKEWDNAQIYRLDVPGWAGSGASLSALKAEHIRMQSLHDTPFQEVDLCLARDRLYYSATYGGRRTLYAYELDTGSVFRSVASDFARSPAWDELSGNLYYVGLSRRGEDLYREKPLRRETAAAWDAADSGVPSAAELEIPAAAISRGGYWDNVATLLPRTLFPVFSLDLI